MSIEKLVAHQLSAENARHRHADACALLAGLEGRLQWVNECPSFAPHFIDHGYAGFSAAEVALMEHHQKSSFYWVARNKVVSWLVSRYFPAARRVLDIGCGTGYVTKAIRNALPEAFIYGTDIYIESIELAAAKLRDEAFLLHLDACDIPFTDSFDLITSFDVLEHIPDDEKVMRETFRALRPGGGVMHFVPQHPFLFSPADEKSHHVRRYGTGELQRKLKGAGFEIVHTTSFMFWLFPLFAASRLKARLLRTYSLEGEHEQPAYLAKLFTAVQDFELSLMRQGMRYPVGVSRIVVAVRP